MLRVVSIAFIHVVRKRHVSVGNAEQRVTNLPQITLSLFIHTASGDLATHIERIYEGVFARTQPLFALRA